ncbi:MAG TPA: iron-sulfur cluster carrier protein MrpORP [Candidatus Hydrogenedentes bacterium]|nr:iron-sulfur cluster carrier protein MrpORP [Candidatus Hydrogenedentota bacterium]
MECTNTEGFSEVARDHATRPRNYGLLDNWNAHACITGPCGDTVEIWLRVENGMIRAATFTTTGCEPSRACGSMATELVIGRPIQSALEIKPADIVGKLEPFPDDHRHCALLAANVMKAAAQDFLDRQKTGSCGSCATDNCSAKGRRQGESEQDYLDRQELARRLCQIKHKVLVLSGKGGVGKSTVAVNLAVSLSLAGKHVGLLDVDIHGPSIPKMLHLEGAPVMNEGSTILPIEVGDMKVLSIGFFLRSTDDAVIWRGPMKMGVIKQFLKDTDWGELDYLVIDSPPGTGDEPLSVCQLIENADGAVIVTTPQDVSVADVRRSIGFCRQLGLPVLGVVENMSGFVCPHCSEVTHIFKTGGGERMANDMGVPFLGRIPLDPQVAEACDAGAPYVHHYARSETAKAFERVIQPILALDGAKTPTQTKEEIKPMRIALPIADGRLAMHFGHCEQFALVDVDPPTKRIIKMEMVGAPEHQPGLLPRWLGEKGAHVIIAGGMGSRAQSLFAEQGIQVVVGAPADAIEDLVKAYLEGALQSGENVCDH